MSKVKKVATPLIKNQKTVYEKFENWSVKKDSKIFFSLITACLVLSFVSFNARISEAHDDALYLEGGWRFVNEFPTFFYTQNAPLYPLFIALIIKLIGFKLLIFKLFSVLFNTLGFILFYKAFKGRIPSIIFIPVAFFQATNHLIIYFASMTFTEAFYFFLQGLFFFYTPKIIDIIEKQGIQFKKQFKIWLIFGLSLFLISTCKSSAIVVIPSVILFFILEKNWKAASLSVGCYLIFKVIYECLVKAIWNGQNQFSGQSKILLQKDPYDKSIGNEDFIGFIHRFIDNCNLSLSKRFYQIIGWRDEANTETYGLITIITIFLILFGFWQFFKQKNKTLILVSLFTISQMALSFFILQIRWDQPRITLVCMPIILILILNTFYYLSNKPGIGKFLYISLIIIFLCSISFSTLKKGIKNLPIVQKNLIGDTYFGYTPDWQNFLKCSEWCADSLSKETLVASRKAPMSFVYGKGKKFFPIYSVIKRDTATNQSNPDSALAYFKQNKVTHVMIGSLRVNPLNASAGIINTVHNIFGPIAQKYPEKLKLVHTEGFFEEAFVYKIIY